VTTRRDPRRGEVWLVDFGDPIGREQSGMRPAVVVSADPLNQSRAGVVIVVPTTTAPRGVPSHVELGPESSGLDEVSYAKCEDVKSVSEQRFVARLGVVNDEAVFDIGRALRFLLDL
jgi:mRNA interferase MazF